MCAAASVYRRESELSNISVWFKHDARDRKVFLSLCKHILGLPVSVMSVKFLVSVPIAHY